MLRYDIYLNLYLGNPKPQKGVFLRHSVCLFYIHQAFWAFFLVCNQLRMVSSCHDKINVYIADFMCISMQSSPSKKLCLPQYNLHPTPKIKLCATKLACTENPQIKQHCYYTPETFTKLLCTLVTIQYSMDLSISKGCCHRLWTR